MSVSMEAAATRATSSADRLTQLRVRLERLKRGEPSTPHDVQRARTQAISQARALSAARERLIVRHRSAAARHLEHAEWLTSSGLTAGAARERDAAGRCYEAIRRFRAMEWPLPTRVASSSPTAVGGAARRMTATGSDDELARLKTMLTAQLLWSGHLGGIDIERRRSWCQSVVAESGGPGFDGWLHAVCVVGASVLPAVRGVSVTITTGAGTEMTAASDVWTSRLQEVELIVGEGPSATAQAENRSLLVRDLATEATGWHGYASAVSELGVRGICAAPIRLRGICAGSLTLYSSSEVAGTSLDPADAAAFADIAAGAMVADMEAIRLGEQPHPGHFSVHVASGALAARLNIAPHEAEARLRAYAFSSGLGLVDAAEQVLSREIDLT